MSYRASSTFRYRRSKPSVARLLVTLLALITFGLQSQVAQTHIHLAPNSFASYGDLAAGKAQAAGLQKQLPDKFPAQDDPANCPICQEIAHTGHFITPAAASLLLPDLAASTVTIVADIPALVLAVSRGWQSRAPPKA